MNNTGNVSEENNGGATRKIVLTGIVIGLAFGFYIGRTMHKEPVKIAKEDTKTIDAPSPLAPKNDTAKTSAPKLTAKDMEKEVTKAIFSGDIVLPKTESVKPTAPAIKDSVSVSGQPAGMNVSVKKVLLSRDGWVAVREYVEGELGNNLGAFLLPAGVSDNVTVNLLRGTKSGNKYAVVLYHDNEDHIFSPRVDTLVGGDNPVLMNFVAQ